MNLILWMDERGAPYAREIYARRPDAGGRWIEVHGALPLPSGNDSLSHMLWVQRERPDVYAHTRVKYQMTGSRSREAGRAHRV